MHIYKEIACMREQGRKMAEKVAGQAQEQMRKALAARERAAAAAKQEKRA